MARRPLRRVLQDAAAVAALIACFGVIRRLGAGYAPAVAPIADATAAVGFLFFTAYMAGRVASGIGLPKITGYLAVGTLVGPEALGALTAANLEDLAILNRLAIGVIAFLAGGELRPSMLRRRGRTIAALMAAEIGTVFAAVYLAVLLAGRWIPFIAGAPFATALVLAAVFASIATIHSPAATIAVLNEEKPHGPVSETVLGIVVAADVVVVLMVSIALAGARTAIGGGGFDASLVARILWELVGAIIAGAILGALLDLYLRQVGGYLQLVAIFLVLLGGQIADALHVEFLLFMLSAGFFVENVSQVDGEPLLRAFGQVSVPAYALFFALAGASIHLEELRMLWPVALLVVGVRAASLWAGCRIGASLAAAEPPVRRYTWLGLVSQAGVALGLVTVAARVLPEAGGAMRTLFLAMIAIHEFVGPILFRLALTRSGESHAAAVHHQPAPLTPRTHG